jgi:hypothetical protein
VPCDPKVVIDQEYGVGKWRKPITDGSHKFRNRKFAGKLTDWEWKNSIKFYNRKGVDRNYTLSFVNKYADKKFDAIDDDD